MYRNILITLFLCAAVSAQQQFTYTTTEDTFVDYDRPCSFHSLMNYAVLHDAKHRGFIQFDPVTMPNIISATIEFQVDYMLYNPYVYIYTTDRFEESTLSWDSADTTIPNSSVDYTVVSNGAGSFTLDVTSAVQAGHTAFMMVSKYGEMDIKTKEHNEPPVLTVTCAD